MSKWLHSKYDPMSISLLDTKSYQYYNYITFLETAYQTHIKFWIFSFAIYVLLLQMRQKAIYTATEADNRYRKYYIFLNGFRWTIQIPQWNQNWNEKSISEDPGSATIRRRRARSAPRGRKSTHNMSTLHFSVTYQNWKGIAFVMQNHAVLFWISKEASNA